jgi:hypothetical protein
MTCEQRTVRGDQCTRSATWAAPDRASGTDEYYCTQHANYYGIPRRQSAYRIDDAGQPLVDETRP